MLCLVGVSMPAAMAAVTFRSSTSLAQANRNSFTLNKPVGVVAGDVMVAQIAHNSGAGTTIAGATGNTIGGLARA